MKKSLRKLSLVLLAGVLLVISIFPVAYADDTPTWSDCYAVGYPNSLGSPKSSGGVQFGGVYVEAAQATSSATRSYSFDSETGVYGCGVMFRASGNPIYMAFKGVNVLEYSSSRDYITITPVTGTPTMVAPTIVWYDPPGFPTQSISALPDDCIWYRIDCTYTNGSSYEGSLSFTLEIPDPDPIEDVITYSDSFISELFTIGTQMSNFIVSNEIVLIGFVLSIVFFLVVGSKKFFRGE